VDLFIFRCLGCGKVAPEYEWGKGKGAEGMGRGSIIAFPKPLCPGCGSAKVDLNHDLRDARPDEEDRATLWRKPT
jgi:hypothetical protein